MQQAVKEVGEHTEYKLAFLESLDPEVSTDNQDKVFCSVYFFLI